MRFDAIGRDIMALIAAWYEYSTVLYIGQTGSRDLGWWHYALAPVGMSRTPPKALCLQYDDVIILQFRVCVWRCFVLALLCQAGCIIHRFEPCVSLVASLGFCSSVLVLRIQT